MYAELPSDLPGLLVSVSQVFSDAPRLELREAREPDPSTVDGGVGFV